ncbi:MULTISPECIES: S1C family serine protease [unclassified Variovorax]|uniref:S1C family serine protease n=1 Tax=unclassified Variovorax TaxID=663243 RepID=UPI000D12800E|nr:MULTISPECIES: serine protease [unclassified Variovorax]AVQ83536.1 serine protease [Variovorax sp. PMC12]QRY32143.1 trypsin-like peptidase domain-containing protein [Variovorax sp. PDNC026]
MSGPVKAVPLRTASAFLGLALAAGAAAALEPEVLFSKVSGSVWAVRTFDAQERPLRAGSAVVIAPGRLVTNCHVLAKASSFVIKQDNVTYGATLEFPDPARDLCQIKVANFTAPPVALAPAGSARVGQRVYAIGNPRGLENTLSEGILSGLRGGTGGGGAGEPEARLLQTTAAISPGSSGGGLFDSEGRLLGITTFAARDGGSLNFAMPVEFLAELPVRAKAMLEARASEPAGSARRGAGSSVALNEPLRAGDALEYVRTDKLTGTRATVIYRVDRINGDEIVFNGGGKVEKTDGQVVSVTSPAGGLFDSSSPPGGWARNNLLPGMRWQANYASAGENQRYELVATVGGERSVRVDGVELQVLSIGYEGWIYASSMSAPLASGSVRFSGAALYSPELRRVVRFEAAYQRGIVSGGNEVLELVRIQR